MPPAELESQDSAPASTPNPLNQYGLRKISGPASSSSTPLDSIPTVARSFDPSSMRAASGPSLNSPKSSPIISSSERLHKSSFKDLVARFNQADEVEQASSTTNLSSSPSIARKPVRSAVPNPTPVPGLSSPRPTGDQHVRTPINQTGTAQSHRAVQHPSNRRSESPRSPSTSGPSAIITTPYPNRPKTSETSESTPQDPRPPLPLFGEVLTSNRYDRENLGHGIPKSRLRSGSEGSMHYPNAMFPHSRDSYVEDTLQIDDSPVEPTRPLAVPSTPTHGRSRSDVTNARNQMARPSAGHADPNSSAQVPLTPSSQQGIWLKTPSPGSGPANAKRLNAIISAPAPKESPPLRSSRPRQDITSAKGASPSGRSPDPKSPEKSKTVTALSNMDIATRRESIRKALREKGWPTDKLPASSPASAATPTTATPTATSPTAATPTTMEVPLLPPDTTNEQALPQLSSATYTRPTPPPKLNVQTAAQRPPSNEPTSGVTQFEEDDSPIVRENQRIPRKPENSSIQSDTSVQAPDSSTGLSQEPANTTPPANTPAGQYRNILSQIMEMKRRDSSREDATPNSSSTLDHDEAGTIQIMLSDTPVFNRPPDGQWHSRDMQNHTEPDAAVAETSQSGDQTTTGQITQTPESNSGNETPNLRQDRDPYGWISRILDQYRESGIVSPEMVHDFQQHMLETDPEITAVDDVDSMTLAKAALEDIIKDHAHSIPAGAQGTSTFVPPREPKDDPFWQGMGSNITVVSSVDPYQLPAGTTGSAFNSPLEVKPSENNLFGPGPTPPPKDASYTPFGTSFASASAAPSGETEGDYKDQPKLPQMPSTNGNLGLSLGARTDPDSTKPSNPVVHSYEPPTQSSQGESSSVATDLASAASTLVPPDRPSTSGASQQDSTVGSSARSVETGMDSSTLGGSPDPDTSGNSTNSQAVEQRRLNQRRHIIKELVDTEFSFNQDMKVIEDIYKGTASSVSALTANDLRILFGNSAQVVEFSEAFLDSLKQASKSVYIMPRNSKWRVNRTSTSDPNSETHTEESSLAGSEATDDERDRKTSLGEAFLTHMNRMEKVYADYLKNHDLANQRLQKLQTVSEVRLWLSECHEYAHDITSAWDLDSLLVKPVQRILKYPLLLRSLLEKTTEDHPDYQSLLLAAKQSEEISHRINESKKRVELLDQISNKTPAKRREFDFSRVFSRKTDKIAHRVGLSEAVEDPDYKRLAEKWGGRFFQLQIVMRDIEMYSKAAEEFMKQFNRYIDGIEEFIEVGHSNSPEIESKWRKFAMTIREMTAIAFADHDNAVRVRCIEPIKTLIRLHEGPERLMQKRKKRIVEYAKYLTAKNRGDKIDRKTQEQGDQFIALNETLKDELPKLFSLTAKLVEACLKNFIDLQTRWHTMWQRKIKHVLEEQSIPGCWADITEAFHSDFSYTEAHVLSLGICNGSFLAETSNFLSSASSLVNDDSNSGGKRPSLVAQKTSPAIGQHEFERRSGGSLSANSFASPRSSSESNVYHPNGHAQATSRYRADSSISTHSNTNNQRGYMYNSSYYVPHQTSRQQQRSIDMTNHNAHYQTQPTSAPRYSGPYNNQQQPPPQPQAQGATRPLSGSTYYSATSVAPGHQDGRAGIYESPEIQSSGVFSSAMPMSDSPNNTRPTSPNAVGVQRDVKILFLAASLFEFHVDGLRREAGYPFLTYAPGEVFDVIAEKGELWLAKNQDDPNGTIGWIWEKHFAKLAAT